MREPRRYEYFTDRSIESDSFSLPLIAAGFTVHRFPFADTTEDQVWIAHCASKGWIGLSGDRKITSRPDELAAVMTSGAALFVLKMGRHTNHPLLAENFLRSAAKIVAFFEEHEAPYVAKVTRPNAKDWAAGKPGRVRIWRTYEDWREHRHRRRPR